MSKFTEAEFTAAIRAAVDERGRDYIYPAPEENPAFDVEVGEGEWLGDDWHSPDGCVYSTPHGDPACIIGLALHKLDPDLVPPHENSNGAAVVLRGLVPEYVAVAAVNAQQKQDRYRTWGEALDGYMGQLRSEYSLAEQPFPYPDYYDGDK